MKPEPRWSHEVFREAIRISGVLKLKTYSQRDYKLLVCDDEDVKRVVKVKDKAVENKKAIIGYLANYEVGEVGSQACTMLTLSQESMIMAVNEQLKSYQMFKNRSVKSES